MKNALSQWLPWAVGLIALILFPHYAGIYYTNVFVGFAIFALYAVTLNLLLGYTGLLSFGHAMFFGIGAYSTALVLTHIQGFPLIPALLAGGVAGGLAAAILSPLLVRVSGTAFAMLTLAFGQLTFVLALKYREVTGGEDGVGGYPIPPLHIPGIASIDMTVASHFFYFAVAVIAVCIYILWFITKTPFGSLMVGIRDNAMRIDYLGYRVPHTKALIFIISGTFAGIAGAVYALLQDLVSTVGVLDIFNSFSPIMMAFIGGVGSFYGPIIGSAIIHLLEDLVFRFTERVDLVNGLIFILVVFFLPGGLVEVFTKVKSLLTGRSALRAAGERVAQEKAS